MIKLFPDLESMSQGAAELLIQRAQRAIRDRNRFSVALSGGSTPRRLYDLLAQDPHRSELSWHCVHVFWGDERCVPPDDPHSNSSLAQKALLDHVPIPPEQIHPISYIESPRRTAERYESLLQTYFAGGPSAFDLILLGLGEDGHTASLFPYSSALRERKRWVAELYRPEEGFHRVTLTVPVINQASTILFLVSGNAKGRALRDVLKGPFDPNRLPAQFICPSNGELIWFVDKDAGGLLANAA